MKKIAIVDDEESCRATLQDCLKRYSQEKDTPIEIKEYCCGYDFLENYHCDFDIVFLDIEMPDIQGLEVAKRIREQDSEVVLVFTTVMAQYAVKGYEVDAMDFIVKPLVYSKFVYKLDKAFKIAVRHPARYVLLKDEEGTQVRIDVKDIYYIESSRHDCYFYTTKGDFSKIEALKNIEIALEEEKFIRTDKSYLVNPMYVEKITKNGFVVHGQEVPVSRAKRKKALDDLTNFLGNQHHC